MSSQVYDFMAHYRAITAKLKKKFLRRPNTAEVRDNYKDLCVALTKECNYPYAAFVCLAQARCEEALENKLGEAETLSRAGQFFFKSEADKAMTSRESFEEDLMDALYCFDAAIDIYLQENKKALAAALCIETSRSLALLGKEEESIPYALRAADLESESPLAAISALTRASQYQINLLRFDAALDSLFRVVDVVLATCHVHSDDRTCALVPVDCFLRAARVCPPGVYRATVADAEVQCLLLFYLIHPDQRGRFPALHLLVQRYSAVEHCPHVAHLSQTLVFLLRTLVMLLDSSKAVVAEAQRMEGGGTESEGRKEDREEGEEEGKEEMDDGDVEDDREALIDLQGELWPLLTCTQNQLLHHIVEKRLER